MLSVFLACEDPYEVASFLVEKLGWRHDNDAFAAGYTYDFTQKWTKAGRPC